jgi:hypothetical protein
VQRRRRLSPFGCTYGVARSKLSKKRESESRAELIAPATKPTEVSGRQQAWSSWGVISDKLPLVAARPWPPPASQTAGEFPRGSAQGPAPGGGSHQRVITTRSPPAARRTRFPEHNQVWRLAWPGTGWVGDPTTGSPPPPSPPVGGPQWSPAVGRWFRSSREGPFFVGAGARCCALGSGNRFCPESS